MGLCENWWYNFHRSYSLHNMIYQHNNSIFILLPLLFAYCTHRWWIRCRTCHTPPPTEFGLFKVYPPCFSSIPPRSSSPYSFLLTSCSPLIKREGRMLAEHTGSTMLLSHGFLSARVLLSLLYLVVRLCSFSSSPLLSSC